MEILIVDSHPGNLQLYRTIFGKRGHAVTEAFNAERGIEAIAESCVQKRPFHVVIVNEVISRDDVLTGCQFIQKVRATVEQIRIVMATGTACRERALDVKADIFLLMPFRINDLINAVETHLEVVR